ncbi:MAG: hydrogenase large subunit [Bellilinea sp.]
MSPDTNKFIIPIGPQHPALKEPANFEFWVDGEIVTGASVRLGYVHRGIEKGAEARTWTQNLYLMERICGICSHIHATAYTLAVEKLAGVEAPPRASAIRQMIAEMERIHSHMLWLGVAAHEGGFDSLFMYSWRDRETVMDLLEKISGNKVHYSANVLGGVKFDITPELVEEIRKGLDYLAERNKFYMDVIMGDETFMGRTRDIGTMTRERAEHLGAIGPTARASGIPRDIRVDAPYLTYSQFPINIQTHTAGDLHARFIVRINETFEAIRVIREIVDSLPAGDLTTRIPRRIPEGEAVSRVEAPRGELFYYVASNGSDKPERVKVRTPSLCNWSTVLSLAVGLKLADMPMLLSGIDPCFSCNDRSIRIKGKVDDPGIWSWEKLRQYGIQYYR